MPDASSVAIIGSGPAGLAVSALLSKKNILHAVYEKNTNAGGLYVQLHSELRLLSPAYFNSLPLSKYRDRIGHNTVGDYARYLRDYIEINKIPLTLNTHISEVKKENQSYRLLCGESEISKHTHVVIATGMASFAKSLGLTVPDTIELEDASQFKGINHYQGKNILVVGSGTSAYEIATLLADTSSVFLSVNKPIKSMPISLAGINFHFFIRPLERIPSTWFPSICQSGIQEHAISQDIKKLIRQQRITVVTPLKQINDKNVELEDGRVESIDIIINCTGYRFDTHILPTDVARHTNGNVLTHRCQSISHPGLYMIGHPCTGGVDSKFLRGIYHDAFRIVKQINI